MAAAGMCGPRRGRASLPNGILACCRELRRSWSAAMTASTGPRSSTATPQTGQAVCRHDRPAFAQAGERDQGLAGGGFVCEVLSAEWGNGLETTSLMKWVPPLTYLAHSFKWGGEICNDRIRRGSGLDECPTLISLTRPLARSIESHSGLRSSYRTSSCSFHGWPDVPALNCQHVSVAPNQPSDVEGRADHPSLPSSLCFLPY